MTAGAVLLLLGAGVTFAAGVGYARDTLRGRVQPNRVTWFVSGVSAWIACAGQVMHLRLILRGERRPETVEQVRGIFGTHAEPTLMMGSGQGQDG